MFKVGDIITNIDAPTIRVKCVSTNPEEYICIDDTGAWGSWRLGYSLKVSLTLPHCKDFWYTVKERKNTKPDWL